MSHVDTIAVGLVLLKNFQKILGTALMTNY